MDWRSRSIKSALLAVQKFPQLRHFVRRNVRTVRKRGDSHHKQPQKVSDLRAGSDFYSPFSAFSRAGEQLRVSQTHSKPFSHTCITLHLHCRLTRAALPIHHTVISCNESWLMTSKSMYSSYRYRCTNLVYFSFRLFFFFPLPRLLVGYKVGICVSSVVCFLTRNIWFID